MADEKSRMTSFRLSPENRAWLESKGNMREFLEKILTAHRTGKVVETGEVLQGEDGKGCIQPLDKQYKPENCPFRIAYPQLQQAKNGLVLQESFCNKCPYYKKDFEAFKVRLRKEAKEDRPRPSTPAQTTTPGPLVQVKTFACINGCGVTLRWPTKAEATKNKNNRPIEIDSGLTHFCPNFRRDKTQTPSKPTKEEKKLVDFEVKCTQCDFKLSSAKFAHELEPIGTMEDAMHLHVRQAHGRVWLEPSEQPGAVATQKQGGGAAP